MHEPLYKLLAVLGSMAHVTSVDFSALSYRRSRRAPKNLFSVNG